MELRAYAERILSGTTIEDKLAGPASGHDASFSDEHPGAALETAPELPGRPLSLAFDRRAGTSSSIPGQFTDKAKSPAKLSDPRGRGLVLHYFANHELLALEIMALALLRFPEAPKSFRLGIARTMTEEQEHLGMYIRRMNALGVQFGDLPVNSYFWRTMREIASPAEYAAAMSLTFEQANLDFALHYERIFRDLGDAETADIMRKIHDDEVRHVQHGVIWMKRFESGKTLWSSYRDHLRYPLTPSRAKGPVFDEHGRARAGIDEEFIRNLRVFTSSKGRPADLWFFNPGCERQIATPAASPFLTGGAAFIEHDLAPLMLYIAAPDDMVMVSRKPSIGFLARLQSSGFTIPEFVECGTSPSIKHIDSVLAGRKLGALRAWGETTAALSWWHPLKRHFTRMPDPWPPGHDGFLGKDFTARVLRDLGAKNPPSVCHNEADVRSAANACAAAGFSHIAIKPVLGASGLGLRRVPVARDVAAPDAARSESNHPVIVEPWLEKVCDLSVLFEVEASGRVRVLDVTRPLVDRAGRYSGHALGRPFTFTDAKGQEFGPEFFAKIYPAWMDELRETALAVGKKMHTAGFSGAAGIDSLVFRDPASGELELRPIVEINARFSMGRVAVAIEKHLSRGQPAIWLHIHKNMLRKLSDEDFREFAASMAERFPLRTATAGGATHIKSGFLPTNDPETAGGILTALFAGPDAANFAWNHFFSRGFPTQGSDSTGTT